MKIQVSKVSKQYVMKVVKEKTQQLPFRKDLLDLVMELRAEKPLMKKKDKRHAPFPRQNIARTSRPDVSELKERRSDRFSHQRKSTE